MIAFTCPKCAEEIEVTDRMAGKEVECPGCGDRIPVPQSDTRPGPGEEEEAARAVTTRKDTGSRRKDEEDEEDEAVSRKVTKGKAKRSRRRDEDEDEDDYPNVAKNRLSHKTLRSIAVFQKGILVCILIEILVAVSLGLLLPRDMSWVTALALCGFGVVASVFVFQLAIQLYGVVLGILLGILSLAPCLGFLVLLLVNSSATSTLQLHGYKVGLLGASLAEFDR